jgi:predicted metalloprotease with PDZ domain
MRALDQQIRAATQGKSSLDTLVATFAKVHRPVTNAAFQTAAAALIGAPAAALADCPA